VKQWKGSCYMWGNLTFLYYLFILFYDADIWFVFFWKCLKKFSLKELVDMLTCNLFETIHIIWLQQYGKKGGWLLTMIFDDYVCALKQSASYNVYLNGGRCKKGPNKDELRLWWTSQIGDPLQMANIIAKYTSGSSFITKTPHLEGQKVFGSMKQKVDIAIGLEGNSHKYDHVIFFYWKLMQRQVALLVQMLMLASPILGLWGMKRLFWPFKDWRFKNGVWRIERCSPSSNTHCFAIQKKSMKHCVTQIIARKNSSWPT
jgi:hypothetical protein